MSEASMLAHHHRQDLELTVEDDVSTCSLDSDMRSGITENGRIYPIPIKHPSNFKGIKTVIWRPMDENAILSQRYSYAIWDVLHEGRHFCA